MKSRMKAKMNEAKAMMDAQMKNLPPEQRQMMEKMMQGRGMPAMQPAGLAKKEMPFKQIPPMR